jgi:hypothetical protein
MSRLKRSIASTLAASLLLTTASAYAQGGPPVGGGGGGAPPSPEGWQVLFDGTTQTSLPFQVRRYFGSPFSYPLTPKYWGGLLSFTPQAGAGVTWVRVRRDEVPLIWGLPYYPGFTGGTPSISGSVLRLIPTGSQAIAVPPAGIGSLASNFTWTAEWTNRFVTIVSDELENGDRMVTFDPPGIIKTVKGNFRKGGEDLPVPNIRDYDGNITVDSAMTFINGYYEHQSTGDPLNPTRDVWVSPHFVASAPLQAIAPAWQSKENPITGAPIRVDWSPAGALYEKWTKLAPGVYLPFPLTSPPPQAPTKTQSVTVIDQTQGPDSLGSGTATYTMRWHYPAENWSVSGPNFFATSSVMDWTIKSSAATPNPVISTQSSLVINYGKGAPYVTYAGSTLSIAAIVLGAAASYNPVLTVPAALATLISTLCGMVGAPEGSDATIPWSGVEDLPAGYLQLPPDKQALHQLNVSILPQDVCAPWKADGYDLAGYTGTVRANVVLGVHFRVRYVSDYQGSAP